VIVPVNAPLFVSSVIVPAASSYVYVVTSPASSV